MRNSISSGPHLIDFLTPHSSFLIAPLEYFTAIFLLAGAEGLVELITDTECDLALAAQGDTQREAIRRVRAKLIADHCGVAPEVAEKAHAVVVIHDISGMGDWIRGVSDQLAEAGYIAIVPDLLSRKTVKKIRIWSAGCSSGWRATSAQICHSRTSAMIVRPAKLIQRLGRTGASSLRTRSGHDWLNRICRSASHIVDIYT